MDKLVRDFIEHKIVFYWQNSSSERVSPIFPSLQHAREWFVDHYFEAYKGPEKRRFKIDRRNLSSDKFNTKRNPYSQGRRVTDKQIKVEIDFADKKIAALIQGDTEDLTTD